MAVCGFVLAVIAIATEFAAGTIEPPPAVISTTTTTRTVVEQNALARGVAQLPAETEPRDVEPVDTKAAAYVGNTRSYKFHRAGCHSLVGCVNCTAKFATREEAIAAGYRACGICTP